MWLRATGKTSLVKRAGLLAVALLLIFDIPASFAVLPQHVAVDTQINSSTSFLMNTENKIASYTSGGTTHYLVFAYNGTYVNWFHSTDLTSWGTKHAISGVTNPFDVKIYGSQMYVIYISGSIVKLLNGTVSGSSITWNSTAATVLTIGTDCFNSPSYPFLKIDSSDGTLYTSCTKGGGGFDEYHLYKSSNGGKTWSLLNYDGAFAFVWNEAYVSPMTTGITMNLFFDGVLNPPVMKYSVYFAGFSAGAYINTSSPVAASTPDYKGAFSIIPDSTNANIQYFTWLTTYGGNYYIVFYRYNSGWTSFKTVATVSSTSYPVISEDVTNGKVIVAWMNGNKLYQRNMTIASGVWGDITQLEDFTLTPSANNRGLTGTQREISYPDGSKHILYGLITGAGAPFNATISIIQSTSPTTTTTTTTSTTTITTQTTTADTIVDAVANQFAAVMENLFPALIIILVFVYLAYKAGASGEVLAYVFIITLVLTSFVNLMPWWITVIVSVIMIAILLNYRQRGGGVP